VVKPNLCGGCRMTVTPQRLQELRAQSALLPCESCGRYLYWLP
jgi:predicted  nucleic acid-binding Zn-ribbon protein